MIIVDNMSKQTFRERESFFLQQASLYLDKKKKRPWGEDNGLGTKEERKMRR